MLSILLVMSLNSSLPQSCTLEDLPMDFYMVASMYGLLQIDVFTKSHFGFGHHLLFHLLARWTDLSFSHPCQLSAVN